MTAHDGATWKSLVTVVAAMGAVAEITMGPACAEVDPQESIRRRELHIAMP